MRYQLVGQREIIVIPFDGLYNYCGLAGIDKKDFKADLLGHTPPLPNSTGKNHVELLSRIQTNGVIICSAYVNNITKISTKRHSVQVLCSTDSLAATNDRDDATSRKRKLSAM